MQVRLAGILVSDQDRALQFYTEVLGFQVKEDIPMGEHKWVTVVSPEDPNGVELVLEPVNFEPANVYQRALYDAGIPITAFHVKDIEATFERLAKLDVHFQMPPMDMGPVRLAVFDDTCGNLIQLVEAID